MILVKCRTCGVRTSREIAARDWPGGICELCRDPEPLRAPGEPSLREEVRASIKRAQQAFASGQYWRPKGRR